MNWEQAGPTMLAALLAVRDEIYRAKIVPTAETVDLICSAFAAVRSAEACHEDYCYIGENR